MATELKLIEAYKKAGFVDETENGYPKLGFIRKLTKFAALLSEVKDKQLAEIKQEKDTREEFYAVVVGDLTDANARIAYLTNALQGLAGDNEFKNDEINDELEARKSYALKIVESKDFTPQQKEMSHAELIEKFEALLSNNNESINEFKSTLKKLSFVNPNTTIENCVKKLQEKERWYGFGADVKAAVDKLIEDFEAMKTTHEIVQENQ